MRKHVGSVCRVPLRHVIHSTLQVMKSNHVSRSRCAVVVMYSEETDDRQDSISGGPETSEKVMIHPSVMCSFHNPLHPFCVFVDKYLSTFLCHGGPCCSTVHERYLSIFLMIVGNINNISYMFTESVLCSRNSCKILRLRLRNFVPHPS